MEPRKTSIIKKTLNPVWNEEFILNVPSSQSKFSIYVYDYDKVGKDDFLGYYEFSIPSVAHGVQVNKVQSLFNKPAKVNNDMNGCGKKLKNSSTKVKKAKDRGTIELVLQYINYEEIIKMITDDTSIIIPAVWNLFPSDETALILATIFDEIKMLLPFIERVLKQEVDRTIQEETLFRDNSMATKLLKEACRVVGDQWLDSLIGDMIRNINEDPGEYEIDPSKIPEGQTLEQNRINLEININLFISKIITGIDTCPLIIRHICNILFTVVDRKYPDSTNTAIGGFLFLRFICPAIFNPDKYGIVESVNMDSRAHLIYITKALQNISNGVHTTEEKLSWFNPIIDETTPILHDFFIDMANCYSYVSVENSDNIPIQNNPVPAEFVVEKMDMLLQIIYENRADIQQKAIQLYPEKKKLIKKIMNETIENMREKKYFASLRDDVTVLSLH
eukprot:TRINITY_DN5897_c0_g1_i2.p1 TRINITY_DN5897_c0_g1~~TRINITY_DN5897_c0_g1_i2.p1  ORF type:complete len:447 (+),score=99.72 TRINITY_DN5897_c0_g1_i2:248-1588(+)